MKGIRIGFSFMVIAELIMLEIGLFLNWESYIINIVAWGIGVLYAIIITALVLWANKGVFGK